MFTGNTGSEGLFDNSNGALTDMLGVTEDYHNNQAPKSANVFSCGYSEDPRVNSLAVDVDYKYEFVVPRHVSNNDALLYVENSIVQDLASSLGCNQMKKNLRRLSENTVMGFQWFEGNHVDRKWLVTLCVFKVLVQALGLLNFLSLL